MMNNYFSLKQADWRSHLAPYTQFLLRWGWFVVLSIILITVCSRLIPDTPSMDSYQATLYVQVQLITGRDNPDEQSIATTFFSEFFTSSNTLSLALPKLNKLPQFHRMQLSDLEALVTITHVNNTSTILLSAQEDTPDDAIILVTNVYQTFLQKAQNERSLVINGLNTVLLSELKEVEDDLANSEAHLQNLIASGQTISSQYRLLSNLQHEQLAQVKMINTLLLTLGQQGSGNNDFFGLSSSSPAITTVPGTGPTENQRLALSPLIGLIMGLGGALLANRFSRRLPFHGKKREVILPRITATIPVLPQLQNNRLQVLEQAGAECLPLLRRLRYQADEHEMRLQLIAVTSPKEHEGKSTIASGLAVASAQSGLQTILVDVNPRQPVLHNWFQLPSTSGTLDTIRSLTAGIIPFLPLLSTSITKLDLLSIGNADQKGTSETLEKVHRIDELHPLTELLSKQADLIIFDGPSLLDDANAVNLVALCDLVLLVVDAQRSNSTTVLEAEALLSEMGISFATVLNRARPASME
jgi:Mrp family chromosome partitioning ATPase